MTRASANRRAVKTAPSEEFLRLTRNLDLAKKPPERFERVQKEPGSMELINGKFVRVE